MKNKLYMLQKCVFSLFIVFLIPLSINAQEAVLAKGKWVKIAITQSGVYKIDRNWLSSAGFEVTTLNPQNIRIYGNGGTPLPQSNKAPRPNDLQENAIQIVGEQDGVFDATDYLIFYAQSPLNWQYNSVNQQFEYLKNPYTDTSFYFITVAESAGKRVQNAPLENITGSPINIFDELVLYEKDLINLLQSGREWYGENFRSEKSRTFSLNTEGLSGADNLVLTTFLMGGAASNTEFQISLNNQTIGTVPVSSVPQGRYELRGRNISQSFKVNVANLAGSPSISVGITYQNGQNNNFEAYLNYLTLQYPKNLQLYGNQTAFRSIKSLQNIYTQFNLSEAPATLQIWDITNIYEAQRQNIAFQNNTAFFTTNTTTLKEFIAFIPENMPSPTVFRNIPNQNLHALNPANLIIITPEKFKSEAERLADFHKNHDKLSVTVVLIEQLYNEFSSGKVDISAIRDFMRLLYWRDTKTVKYLLLFGDATFDYKNILKKGNNWIPIYQSYQSLDPIYSYSSDDFFGFLEENEGEWLETINSTTGDHTLEIGIGRLPINTLEEAKVVVDKIIHYSSSPKNLGTWRQKVVFVADDGDFNIHQNDAERLANMIESKYAQYNVEKLYLDAFPQISSPDGERSPQIVTQINNQIERGMLILNYTGHGGEVGWAEEGLLDLEQINSWENYDALPFMVTATCEFGRYDNPDLASGAEQALLSPKGGVIGLTTTTRPVFSNTNFLLNRALYQVIFESINGEMPRLGDIQRQTKNTSLVGSGNRNFALLADPALRLNYPQEKIVITKINGQNIGLTDTLRALQQVKLSGEVRDAQGNLLQNYEGVLEVSIFDNKQQFKTLGNENSPMNYTLQNSLLFKGKVSVKQGIFEVNFIIPKDIDYSFQAGKGSFYATPKNGLQDAGGAFQNVIIGGTSAHIPKDDTPPVIRLFMDDTTFVSRDLVGTDSKLLALLADENGLNISRSGFGHEMIAILDEDSENPIVLNQYYTANLDDFRTGQIVYPFENLSEGWHTLSLTAWDTHNNSQKSNIEFLVSNSAVLALRDVIAYPNPFADKTTFLIDHNRQGEDLSLFIEIYNREGRRIRQLNYQLSQSNSRTEDIFWDGRDDSGNVVSSGVYVFKIGLYSQKDGTQSHYNSQVVIIR